MINDNNIDEHELSREQLVDLYEAQVQLFKDRIETLENQLNLAKQIVESVTRICLS